IGVMPAFRLRVFYTKKERLRFLGHLDLTKLLVLLFRRTKLPLAYSGGYNPRARIQFAPPLPVGFEGEEEIVDVLLTEPVDFPSVREALNEMAPAGLKFIRLQQIALQKPSIEASAISAEYLAVLPKEKFNLKFERQREVKGLLNYSSEETGEEIKVNLTVSLKPGEYNNPLKILSQLLEKEITLADVNYISRQKIFLKD
ncbi:MAG: TIGR03936 family radical SAM-associated protein, partial [Candidatus Sumerlaeia bacterium]|nr:TIGR03936 family radical SAM-associated protein [Candidatus Sumerlaeia bacterium]